MQCLTDTTGGTYSISTPQPDTYTECVNILVSPTELSSDIFNLTLEQGAQIGGAIIFVWAVAWAFRAAISSLNSHNESENSNE